MNKWLGEYNTHFIKYLVIRNWYKLIIKQGKNIFKMKMNR